MGMVEKLTVNVKVSLLFYSLTQKAQIEKLENYLGLIFFVDDEYQ